MRIRHTMNTKTLIPIAGAWMLSIGIAYHIGHSHSISEETSDSNTSSSGSQEKKRTHLRPLPQTQSNTAVARNSAAYSPHSSARTATRTSVMSISDIQRLSDPLERSRQLLMLIDSYSTEDYAAALTHYNSRSLPTERSTERNLLLSAWAKLDPTAAIEFTQAGHNKTNSTQQVVASWASVDPDAALDWARNNHDEDSPNPWLTGVIQGIAGTNSALATTLLQELPYSQERGNALKAIIPYIADLGAAEATAWLNNISDERLQKGATRYLATSLAEENPADASQWVSSLTDGSQRTSAIEQVINSWASQDSQAAKEWLESLPASDQIAAEPNFISQYAAQDPESAADWLDERGDSENYQELLQKFAQSSISADPVIALNYGNEIENENSRSRTVSRALWTLYRQDKESARQWIQNNELPSRVKRRVDRMMQQ